MALHTILKSFEELTTAELYELLYLRSEVFIVEQKCAYTDIDHKDQKSHHLFLYENEELVAYSRIIPAGVSYDGVSFGRVVVSPSLRGKGLGKRIVEEAIKSCYQLFGNRSITISAQLHLSAFYASFGFVEVGEAYDEDGIMHIRMIKQ